MGVEWGLKHPALWGADGDADGWGWADRTSFIHRQI